MKRVRPRTESVCAPTEQSMLLDNAVAKLIHTRVEHVGDVSKFLEHVAVGLVHAVRVHSNVKVNRASHPQRRHWSILGIVRHLHMARILK